MCLMSKAYANHERWLEIARKFVCCEFEHDIVQEMYIKLESNYTEEKATINGNLNEGLCYIIIRNLCYNLNAAQSKKLKLVDIDAEVNKIESPIEDENNNHELIEVIETELQKFDDYEKILFEQIYHRGLSMRKISRNTGISLGSIFYTMKHAKNTIRAAAEKKGS